MSYNLLSGSVNFAGNQQGTIEDVVDTHSAQTITGSKDFNSLTGSHIHAKNRIRIATTSGTHTLTMIGDISASSNITASAYYGDGSNLDGIDGGISFDGSTADGILTFKDADEATVESQLTFNGTVLDFKGSSISGSGNISGSQFYGTWAGSNINGSQIQKNANGAIGDSSGLTLTTTGVTSENTPGGSARVFIDESGIKYATITNILSNNAAVRNYDDVGGAAHKILTSNGNNNISAESKLTFDGNQMVLSGSMFTNSHMSASGDLKIGNDISGSRSAYFRGNITASNIGVGDRIRHVGDVNTYINFALDNISLVAGGSQMFTTYGNLTPKRNQFADANFRIMTDFNNFDIVKATGLVGIGVSDPDTALEIMSASATQLKLSYDGSKYTTFGVSSGGDLTITPQGGDTTLASNVSIDGNTTLGNAHSDIVTFNSSTAQNPNGLWFSNNINVTGAISGSGNLQIGGTATFNGDVAISGSTPFLSIGDSQPEDCGIFLNSSGSGMTGIDYYVAIDYSYNSNNGAFMIGAGTAVGQNVAFQVNNGRIGISQPNSQVTPSSFSVESGKHLIIGSMGTQSPLPAHDQNETVIAQATDVAGQALKIPENSVITRVALIVTAASNLSTHNAAVFLASESNASADSALSDKIELLGAGATGTRSTDNNGSATDIDLKQGKEVWINNDLNWVGGDRYVYLVNAGTSNGQASAADPCSVIVYVEYYGID